MTAAPLSMHMHGLSQQAANLGIQWHVMAMYGPGFFTGRLIQRFGAVRMAAAGLLITAASVAVGLSGLGVYHYWLSLISLGIGWNFGFTGASAKIIDFHRRKRRPRFSRSTIFGLRRDDRGVVFRPGFCSTPSAGTPCCGAPGPGCGGVVGPAAAPPYPHPALSAWPTAARGRLCFFSHALLKFI